MAPRRRLALLSPVLLLAAACTTDGGTRLGAADLAADPTNPGLVGLAPNGTVQLSSDGGETWAEAGQVPGNAAADG